MGERDVGDEEDGTCCGGVGKSSVLISSGLGVSRGSSVCSGIDVSIGAGMAETGDGVVGVLGVMVGSRTLAGGVGLGVGGNCIFDMRFSVRAVASASFQSAPRLWGRARSGTPFVTLGVAGCGVRLSGRVLLSASGDDGVIGGVSGSGTNLPSLPLLIVESLRPKAGRWGLVVISSEEVRTKTAVIDQ